MQGSDEIPPVYSMPAMIEKVTTRKGDKSLVVTISTQEITSLQKAVIMDMQDKHIFFFLSEATLDADQVLEVMPEIRPVGEKWTSSQRLRFSLQGLHQAQGGTEADFEDWYRIKMLELVEHYNKKTKEILNSKR